MASLRRIRPEDPDHVTALNAVFPFQGYVEVAESRGIKYSQLAQVSRYVYDNCWLWRDLSPMSQTKGQTLSKDFLNMYHIGDWVIRPATKANDCAFVELFTSEPQNPDWFICHWWGDKYFQLLDSVQEHREIRAITPLSDTVYWICAYANRQHSSERADDFHDEGSFKALRHSHGVLLTLGCPADMRDGSAMAFKRTWCIFEICLAVFSLKRPVDVSVSNGRTHILTDGFTDQEQHSETRYVGRGFRNKIRRENGFPVHALAAVLGCCIENSASSVDTDRTWILQSVASGTMFGGTPSCKQNFIERMNKQMRAHFAVAMWYQAVESESFNTEQLADALVTDEWRARLSLSFALCSKFDDAQLRILSRGIPKHLLSLELSFESCQHVSNLGIEYLAKALPETLDTLVLNFQMCTNISNMGIDTLGDCFSSHLKVLRLNFESDRRILSVHGLTDGIACLPNLLVLDLNLAALEQLDNKEVIGLAKVLPRRLKNLSLSFALCSRIDNGGVVVIADRLPCSLTTLNLNFKGCKNISHPAVDALAQHLPQGLLALHFNFEDCSLIREMSITGLVRRLPESLYGAKVNLQGTSVSEEKLWICRRLDRMREWIPASHDMQDVCRTGDETHVSTTLLPESALWNDTLYLRSINYSVVASAESPHNSSARGGSSPKLRWKSPSSRSASGKSPSSRSVGTPSSKSKKASLLELDRKCWPDCPTPKSKIMKSRSCPQLQPVRASKPPPSLAWVNSPEAIFPETRRLFRGRSEPHNLWMP